ncbi:MAG: prenyltransferase [Wenzhouxiangellaceae bacterium]
MSRMTLLRASRPNFLVLAPICAGLGIVLAWRQGVPLEPLHLTLVMTGALLAHAAVNLLNEYQDFRSGLDLITIRTPFSGGSGALPENPDAAPRVLAAAMATTAIVSMIGLYFLWLRGLPMLLPGIGGLILVLGYTHWITRSPWLCLLAPGLGFGPVMILATQIALGGNPGGDSVLVAVVMMLLVSELLLINQIPDTDADRRVGRRHLPIVLGLHTAVRVVTALLLGAYVLLALAVAAALLPVAAGLSLLPLPLAIRVAAQLPRVLEDPAGLSRILGINVATILATPVLLGLGLSIGSAIFPNVA